MTLTRWQRLIKQKMIIRLKIGIAVILATTLLTAVYLGFQEDAVPATATATTDKPFFSFFFPNWSSVLTTGLPQLGPVVDRQAQSVNEEELSLRRFFRDTVWFLIQVDVGDMRTVLRRQIPLLSAVKIPGTRWGGDVRRPTIQFKPKPSLPVNKPLVAIYHTHTSESFVPTTGVTHRRGGQIGEIAAVGEALVQNLSKYKIQTIHSKQVHDYPSFMKAYGPSEVTVKKILADHPSIQVVIDLHRDAEKRENVIAEVNGTPVARIAFVVAVGQEDLVQPLWEKNLAFARQVNEKLDKYFPGVSRGIQTVEWRYNQHLHERALLIEVGSQETSQEEAERAMDILGGVLVEILAESGNFGVQ